jgi:hypothetical protein
MVDGLMRQVAFETMRDDYEDEIEALAEWTDRVRQSRTAWRDRAGAGGDNA